MNAIAKYPEERLQQLTNMVIDQCLTNAGHWITINKSHGVANQKEIFDRVRDVLKIMGIKYAIPKPELSPVERKIVGYSYQIRVLTERQILHWEQQGKAKLIPIEHYGWMEQ